MRYLIVTCHSDPFAAKQDDLSVVGEQEGEFATEAELSAWLLAQADKSPNDYAVSVYENADRKPLRLVQTVVAMGESVVMFSRNGGRGEFTRPHPADRRAGVRGPDGCRRG